VYCIIGEDKSDVNTLKVIVRRIAGDKSIPVQGKGYNGAPEMLRKAAKQMNAFQSTGCRKFVVAYDSDGEDAKERFATVVECVIDKAKLEGPCCILIPVQEIEAWILADLPAVTNVISGWSPTESFANPENQDDPKELLESLSKATNKKPRYDHTLHNEKVAEHLDLDVVFKKCPSFRPLRELVVAGKGNCG